MHPLVSDALRRGLSRIVFKKRLPKEFGSLPVFVTPRADLRVLWPSYQKSALDLMLIVRHFVSPSHCVWDIGSNQGIFSVCAAYKAGPTGQVFSVEADPTYAALQHRTFSALPPGNAPCSVLCAAVADRGGILDFSVSARGHARSGLTKVAIERVASHKPVVAVTLDYLLDFWPAPNVAKIDVEGADLLVLQGASRLLREANPLIYIEMTPETYPHSSDLLRAAGYELFHLHGDGSLSPLIQFSPYVVARPGR